METAGQAGLGTRRPVPVNKVPSDPEKVRNFEEKYRKALNEKPLRVSRDENNVKVHHRLDAMSIVTWVLQKT